MNHMCIVRRKRVVTVPKLINHAPPHTLYRYTHCFARHPLLSSSRAPKTSLPSASSDLARTHTRSLLTSNIPSPSSSLHRNIFSHPTRSYSLKMSSDSSSKLIDGTQLAKEIRQGVSQKIAEIQAKSPKFKPSLAIIQQGDRPDSTTYVNMKRKAAEEAGIAFVHLILPETAPEEELAREISRLNEDPSVHGLLVQLPLSASIGQEGERRLTEAVSPQKDVDGFHAYNIGLLSSRGSEPLFNPCTPAGVIRLIESTGFQLSGKQAVVLGRSDIVGTPVCSLLRRRDATVTQCHRYTQDLPSILKNADVVVSAIGKAEFVQGQWLKPGCIVIDVGTNFIPDASKKIRPTIGW
ncbi:hypothetical protein Pst134EB_014557 [Puccinia striiformis f. sp. tritici]|nr:hypothetical protein Pst134EB_014557 [Puccinia striiformis f. sp. tritici]